MACEICGQEGSHSSKCPYYSPGKPVYHCSACGEGIYEDEEYIDNNEGEYRHYDCFCGMKDLLEWLGYEIKTMEDVKDTYEVDD